MIRLHIILAVLLFAVPISAQTTIHTDIASFNAALAGDAVVTTLDFDSLIAGDTISDAAEIQGFTFDFDFDGVLLKVADTNTTSSMPNFLGTTDLDILQDGDDFSLTFESSKAFGINIVTADVLLDDDISLTFNGTTVSLVGLDVEQTLSDGSFVYFLGVTSQDQTDTMAVVTTLGDGVFLYNVDNIVRAEDPKTLLGDVNLDGVINLLDVEPFIDRLSTGLFQAEADCDENGVVNLLDVEPFISILSGG